jgi:hypothetical protein
MNKLTNTQRLQKRVQELERQLLESKAQQAGVYHLAAKELKKASVDHMYASGVIITVTKLGGQQVCEPFMVRDGLSTETITALTNDMIRSYELATLLEPK